MMIRYCQEVSKGKVRDMERSKVFEMVCEYIQDNGYDCSFRENYSGRFMYGREVPAIVTDAPATLVGFLISEVLADNGIEVDADYVDLQEDSMGRQKVYY